MKRTFFAIATATAALALAITAPGCTPAVQAPAGQKTTATTAKTGDSQTHEAEAPHERYNAAAGRTFLDTLNRGKEIALAAEELPALEVAPDPPPPAQGGGTGAEEPRFRIQILASSQVDMVRKEKLAAEAAIGQPVFMASEQSLYKLYVGGFKTRDEAEIALKEVKKKGYGDAWIVGAK